MIGYIDGCCKGNPGPAGIGGHGKFDDGFTFKFYCCIGESTNNEAEYRALIEMLEQIIASADRLNPSERIIIRSDSQLVVNQMEGSYQVKNPRILKLYTKANELISCLSNKVFFEKVSRKDNELADNLANMSFHKI